MQSRYDARNRLTETSRGGQIWQQSQGIQMMRFISPTHTDSTCLDADLVARIHASTLLEIDAELCASLIGPLQRCWPELTTVYSDLWLGSASALDRRATRYYPKTGLLRIDVKVDARQFGLRDWDALIRLLVGLCAYALVHVAERKGRSGDDLRLAVEGTVQQIPYTAMQIFRAIRDENIGRARQVSK